MGYRIVRRDGTSTVRIEADHQVRVGREVYAGQQIDLVGGDDPVEAGDSLSGKGVVLLGSALVHTQHADGQINLTAPGDIDVLPAVHVQELEPALWPEAANGRLSADVVIDLSVDRGFTYGASVTIRAADTADNTTLADLAADVQAAIDAAPWVVRASQDFRYPVGSSYTPSLSPAEVRVTLRDGKLLWTSPYTLAVASSSTNADLLGFDILAGPQQTSATRYAIYAPGAGSVVNIGPDGPAADSAQLYLGGRLLAHTGVNLFGGWQSGDLQLSPAGLDLDYSGAIETLAGSIRFAGGDVFELKGDLIARGAGADVTVSANTSLVLSGHIVADDVVDLRADGPGGTVRINPTGRVDAAEQITLHAKEDVIVDGLVGSVVAPRALEVVAELGDVQVLSGAGRLQAAQTVTVEAENIDYAGVLITNGATPAAGDVEVTLDARTSLRLSGGFDTAGSVRVTSPSLEIYDFTAKQSGAGSTWTIETDGALSLGKITPVAGGGYESRAAQIQAVDSLVIDLQYPITVVAGSQLGVSGDNGQIRLTAPVLDIVGGLYAGAAFGTDRRRSGKAAAPDIVLDAGRITVGGLGPDAGGTLVTRGGVLAATGLISITADDDGLDSLFKLEGPSRIQTTPPGSEALAPAADPPAVEIASAGRVLIYGVIDAQGVGADVSLTAPHTVLIDGSVHATDQLTVTGGDLDPQSVVLTQLLLQTDANGRLLDAQGRLIDQQGFLINAQGQFVDAGGNLLAAGAEPVVGGAPVRLSGGSLDAAHVVITGPKKLDLLGQVAR